MPRLRKISGRDWVRILCRNFGFQEIRQRGSHIVPRKDTPKGRIGTVVPDHKELKVGTLKGILALAKVSAEEFSEHQ